MRSGRPWNGATRPYVVLSSYATALFIGDPVIKMGDMNTAVVKGGLQTYDVGALQAVNKATVGDGNAITGVIVAIEPVASDLEKPYSPASTEAIVHVCDDPDVLFEIQADAALTAAASVGLNAVLIATTAGDTVTGLSGIELDSGTSDAPAADASNQLLIVAPVTRPDQDYTGKPKFEVLINNHTEAAAAVLGIS